MMRPTFDNFVAPRFEPVCSIASATFSDYADHLSAIYARDNHLCEGISSSRDCSSCKLRLCRFRASVCCLASVVVLPWVTWAQGFSSPRPMVAALKAPTPYGRTLSFTASAARLLEVMDSCPQASWDPLPQILSSHRRSGSRRRTHWASMYRIQMV
jgi:hypothetical protein